MSEAKRFLNGSLILNLDMNALLPDWLAMAKAHLLKDYGSKSFNQYRPI